MPSLSSLRKALNNPPNVLRVVCVLLFLALIANLFFHGSKPYAVGLVPHPWDKVVHALLFAILATLIRLTLPTLPSVGVLTFIGAIALADELHQLRLPGRNADVIDWVADVAGAAVALLVIKLVIKRSSSLHTKA
jgi:VanZ family protein